MNERSSTLLAALFLFQITGFLWSCQSTKDAQPEPLVPQIDGEWWRVASNPDLGELSTERQQPVDFGIWQAADGTWQLWSCIRHTAETGKTRLFHRWEGKNLTDTDWTSMGVTMRADTALGEEAGGMQAPYVLQYEGEYLMFYGDWNRICLAKSQDGKTFERVIRNGSPAIFGDPAEKNTRDAMVIRMDDLWYCYYTAHPNDIGAVYLRTSPDLNTWSDSEIVAFGGQAGNNKFWYAECPFVVQHPNGLFFHFRTQAYGKGLANKGQNVQQTSVYRSPDPADFGVEDDKYFIGTLPVAAPEIFQFQDQWYIAALTPDLDGIRITKLKWTRPSAG